MSEFVLDASAVLTLLNQEHGHEEVTAAIVQGSAMSVVNLSDGCRRVEPIPEPEEL